MKSSALEKDIAGSVKAEGKAAVSIEHAPSLSLSPALSTISIPYFTLVFSREYLQKNWHGAWASGTL